ncbi:HAD domain-containing protein [Microvirga yunnanensis]
MAASPLVYLDIDGVIVTDRSTKLGGAGYIPPGSAAMVVDILDQTGARLVVASTWRRDADCRDKLAKAGIGQDRYFIDWRTPDLLPEEEIADVPIRGSEIDRHLQRHRPARYVIIDDDPGMLPHQKHFHIQVDPSIGLTWTDAETAIALLRG